ncbi:recombinase family protein [Dehalococcoidia bacterium]|nr:recombinase family protein [Dehalococcoidia bacterium]
MNEPEANSNNKSAPKKAVGFFKVHGDVVEGQERKSLIDQEAAFHLFCNREGYEPADTFAEGERVGNGFAAYAEMVRYIRNAGDVSAVVVADIGSLGPDREEVTIALLELHDLGAPVYLAEGQAVDPYAVLDGSWPKPREQSDMRERIKAAMRNRAIRGEGLGKPPYGYKIGANRKLETVPHEAEVVNLVYSLYTKENHGIRLIVRHLNENGITTRRGRNWSMVTIRDILRNRAYLGTYTRFGLRVPGSHPAIITPDQFRWAQSKLEERRPTRKAVQAKPFLLSGMVYCGYCGNRMVGVTRRQAWTRRKDGSRAQQEYRYYQCQSRTNQGVCQYHTHKSTDLELGVVKDLRSFEQQLTGLKSRKDVKATEAAIQREKKRLGTARDKIESRLRRSIKQVSEGKLSLQRFRTQSGELISTRRVLLGRIDQLEWNGTTDDDSNPLKHAVDALRKMADGWDTLEFVDKRMGLESLLGQVKVFDDRFELALRPDLTG